MLLARTPHMCTHTKTGTPTLEIRTGAYWEEFHQSHEQMLYVNNK